MPPLEGAVLDAQAVVRELVNARLGGRELGLLGGKAPPGVIEGAKNNLLGVNVAYALFLGARQVFRQAEQSECASVVAPFVHVPILRMRVRKRYSAFAESEL